MAKEEILRQNDININRWPDTKVLILKSMDEWAEIQAIAFSEWMDDNYICVAKGEWINSSGDPAPKFTTPFLYKLFIDTLK